MTPTDIRALPDAARTVLFVMLAEARYGRRWKARFGREFGYSSGNTVHNWIRGGHVPLAVVYALAAWADAVAYELAAWAEVAALSSPRE